MTVGALAATTLGVVFLVAGAAKVAAGQRWTVQARELGVPGLIAHTVPWVEISLGAILCAQLARPLAAGAAGVVLVTFTALLALRLKQGQRPPCACFGAWSAKPLSWQHLARNVGLIALAAVAAVGS